MDVLLIEDDIQLNSTITKYHFNIKHLAKISKVLDIPIEKFFICH